jgi:hypothetical protein
MQGLAATLRFMFYASLRLNRRHRCVVLLVDDALLIHNFVVDLDQTRV